MLPRVIQREPKPGKVNGQPIIKRVSGGRVDYGAGGKWYATLAAARAALRTP